MDILITGANRGLGYSLTLEGLRRGHIIHAAVRNVDEAGPLKQLAETFSHNLLLTEMDVSKEQSVIKALHQTKQRTASLDGIINNAAVMEESTKYLEDLDMDLVRWTFEVNTFGPMQVVKHFLPLIYKGTTPSIINISSEAGTILNAFSTNYPYSMSKTALNMFSERLRAYVKDKDIIVYAVHPGWMKTDMGGEEAPLDPNETASGIFDLLERKVTVNSKISFIDFRGRPMPL
ncbi:SDR family oxidoreductase [Paenibacillus eucommiae]|uniref:NAD(P)-dependent dehydrogenase (Short-subunit alcohol dehydrogenase family) n=1 Tax=Paenibacillus eucommiae TaxID=1355755 RepID=A0ABS4JB68_9BACL|nr:SDR family oxidoreductase [Paenibacillus eucommiae]MBP1995984.1 NAD(P)-dependent dehydrogenase (short-subunit alcohol dehydrogenase family) [Paenibacillus eucommiae]